MRRYIFAGIFLTFGMLFSVPGFCEDSSQNQKSNPASGSIPTASGQAVEEIEFIPPEKRLEAFRKAEEERVEKLRKTEADRAAALRVAQEAREEAARARSFGIPSSKSPDEK